MVFDIIRIEEGLVFQRDTFPGGPSAFFADVAQLTFMARNILYIMQTLLGDGVVVSKSLYQFITVIILLNVFFYLVDLSLLCCLAIRPDHCDTMRPVVRYCW